MCREKLVYWALPTAMQTIGPPPSERPRATWLAQCGALDEDQARPRFQQSQQYFGELAGYSENQYVGLNHTDHTIPSGHARGTAEQGGFEVGREVGDARRGVRVASLR